jgi:hypothetical protein
MIQFTFRDQFIQDYLCPCKTEDCNNEELNSPKAIADYYKSFEEVKQKIVDLDGLIDLYVDLPSEGRQVFTKWRATYPNQMSMRAKTFFLKSNKPLSTVAKIILNNFEKKYLYHAIDDVLYSLKSKSVERDNLLEILYTPVLALQNHFSIDFFDIWIDEIYIHKVSKDNKFLANCTSKIEPFDYITIKLVYNKKLLPKKTESFW